MQAVVCEQYESPENLLKSEIDDPVPRGNEVVIEIKATGLGYVDALTVAGLYQIKPRLPFIPGNEIAGVVCQIGEGVKHLRVGQRVVAMPPNGGLAEKVALPEDRCFSIPEVLSYGAGASFLTNYCTAYHGLVQCGHLQQGETLLILGASGGVGTAAIDVGRAMGAHIIAAASTDEKRKMCLELGVNDVIDYSVENWRDQLKAALGKRQLDLVYDPVGGNYAEPALRSLGPGGRFLVVGFAGGEIPRVALNLPLLKRCSIVGVNWGGFIAGNPNESRPVLNTLLGWIAEGKLNPQPGESYPLAEAGAAMMKMLNREAIGKVVISMENKT